MNEVYNRFHFILSGRATSLLGHAFRCRRWPSNECCWCPALSGTCWLVCRQNCLANGPSIQHNLTSQSKNPASYFFHCLEQIGLKTKHLQKFKTVRRNLKAGSHVRLKHTCKHKHKKKCVWTGAQQACKCKQKKKKRFPSYACACVAPGWHLLLCVFVLMLVLVLPWVGTYFCVCLSLCLRRTCEPASKMWSLKWKLSMSTFLLVVQRNKGVKGLMWRGWIHSRQYWKKMLTMIVLIIPHLCLFVFPAISSKNCGDAPPLWAGSSNVDTNVATHPMCRPCHHMILLCAESCFVSVFICCVLNYSLCWWKNIAQFPFFFVNI